MTHFEVSATFPMPERIAKAGMWANMRYPQTATGLNLMIGEAASTCILQGELTWEQLRRAELTQEHIDNLSEAVGKMHAVYKVPDKLRTVNEPPEPKTFTAERFGKLTSGAIEATHTATATFALLTLPEESPMLPGYPPHTVKSKERITAENAIIDELYRRPSPEADFRPESVALGYLWKSAAASLSSEPARLVSKTYRDSFRNYMASEPSPEAEKQLRDTLLVSARMLRTIIGAGMAECVPEIAETTGVEIDEGTIQTFLSDTVHGIVLPANRTRQLAASASR